MKSSHLTILAVAAVVAVGGAAASMFTGPGRGDNVMASGRIFPALAGQINDVAAVTVARKDETVTLKRVNDAWVVADKSDYPADFKKVRALLVDLAQMRPLEEKTSSPALFSSLELEDLSTPDAKSTLVTLKDGAGKDLLAIYIGKQRFGRGPAAGGANAGDGTYIRKAGDNQSWLAQAKLSPDKGSLAWLDKAIVNVARERVASAVVVQPEGDQVKVEKAKATDKDFKLDGKIPAGQKIKSEWDVNQVASPLDLLDLDDVRPAAQTPAPSRAAYAEYRTFDGLVVRATLAPKDDQQWVLFQGRYEPRATAPGEDEVKEGKLKTPEEVQKEVDAFNARVSGWAYKIADWKLEYMRRKFVELTEADKKS